MQTQKEPPMNSFPENDAVWLDQADREVEATAEQMRRSRKLDFALFLIGVGFVMGTVFGCWLNEVCR